MLLRDPRSSGLLDPQADAVGRVLQPGIRATVDRALAWRAGGLRRVVFFLFHVMTMLVATVRTSAHEYFRETGTALDYDIVALWLPRPRDVKQMTPLSACGSRGRPLLRDSGPLACVARLRPVAGMAGSIPGRTAQRASFFRILSGLSSRSARFRLSRC